jgi:hypothetical protein
MAILGGGPEVRDLQHWSMSNEGFAHDAYTFNCGPAAYYGISLDFGYRDAHAQSRTYRLCFQNLHLPYL